MYAGSRVTARPTASVKSSIEMAKDLAPEMKLVTLGLLAGDLKLAATEMEAHSRRARSLDLNQTRVESGR